MRAARDGSIRLMAAQRRRSAPSSTAVGDVLFVRDDAARTEPGSAIGAGEAVANLYNRSLDVLNALRQRGRGGDERRQTPRFPITRCADLVGRTAAAIREAEKDGRLPTVDRTPTGRRVGYTLTEVNAMRAVFGTQPWRAPDDPVSIIAVQNFKGGVGKSTVSTHLAQYLAIQGYRVCLVDCDSQGSSTSLFGYVPDLDIGESETLYPFIRNAEMSSLAYAVRDTHWDGLFLIPANLHLYSAEYELAARMARDEATLLNRLAQGIASIEEHFDVIILDPPPALGAISLAVMRAANALLVPVPPTVVDFTSTASFLAMLHETMAVLEARGMPVVLNWMRVLATRVDEQKSIQRELMGMMRSVFGDLMLRTSLKDSAEIDNASARLMSVYELEQPVTSRETHRRCVTYLDAVNAEVETQIRLTWPSHAERLRQTGVL